MASTACTSLGRRLRLAVAGAAVATVLTAASAAAAPAPMQVQAPGMSRPGASPSRDTSTGSPPPGFLLERGRFTPVAPPPGLEDLAPIAPIDLNDRGQIVGTYQDPNGGAARGYLLDKGGRFTKINPPGAKGTQPQGINNRGQIVGKYSTTTGAVSDNGAQVRGFLLDRGRYLRLDFPGSVTSQALDINDRGQIVGEYQDANGRFHGYLWERGRFRTLPTGAALGINNRAQVVGQYLDTGGRLHGFLWERGRLVTIDVPGALQATAEGLNDRGQVVGARFNDLDLTGARGFLLAKGVKGPFTSISFPGAPRTLASGINDRGQIVGFYENPTFTPTPPPTGTPPSMGRTA
jgi:probable HAF family extracellular repeat protein